MNTLMLINMGSRLICITYFHIERLTLDSFAINYKYICIETLFVFLMSFL